MSWRLSQLHTIHGSIELSSLISITHEFNVNEYIVELGIGRTTWSLFSRSDKPHINRIRMVTNFNKTILAGYGRKEGYVYSRNHGDDNEQNIIAFYGRADENSLYHLGVITAIS